MSNQPPSDEPDRRGTNTGDPVDPGAMDRSFIDTENQERVWEIPDRPPPSAPPLSSDTTSAAEAAARARRALTATVVKHAAESQRLDRLLNRAANWLATLDAWIDTSPETTRIDQWAIHLSARFRAKEAKYDRIRRACNHARYDESYDLYLGRAAIYAGIAAGFGALLGVLFTVWFALNGVFAGMSTNVEAPPVIGRTISQHRVLFGGTALTLTLTATAGLTTWKVLSYLPLLSRYQRRRKIDQLLPNGVVYMYSLSRGQLPLVRVVELMAAATGPYGALAEEFQLIVNEMQYRGHDLRHAMQTVRDRTPSADLADFLNDLSTVLDSGARVSPFLDDKTHEFHERARRNQENFLSVLELIAELYVIMQVVGVLLLVTLLVVITTISGSTLVYLYPVIYILIPGGAVAFMLLFDGLSIDETEATAVDPTPTGSPNIRSATDLEARAAAPSPNGSLPTQWPDGQPPSKRERAHFSNPAKPDSDVEANDATGALNTKLEDTGAGRVPEEAPRAPLTESRRLLRDLAQAKRRQRIRAILRTPFDHPRRQPLAALGWSTPLALGLVSLFVALGIASPAALGTRPIWTTTVLGVLPVMVTLGPVMGYHELRTRRQRQINRELPDIVRQLASANEAGVPLAHAFSVVGETATGLLANEFQQLGDALEWNLSLDAGLTLTAARLRNPRFTRVASLLRKSSSATSDLQAVLRAIETDLRNAAELDRERHRKMFIYVFLAALGYLVFLGIMAVLYSQLLTQLAVIRAGPVPGGSVTGGGTGPLTGAAGAAVNLPTFRMLFYHAAVLQAIFSGLAAGQLGHNHVLSGLKYALGFLGLAAVVFLWL